jgi:hypothetical protein
MRFYCVRKLKFYVEHYNNGCECVVMSGIHRYDNVIIQKTLMDILLSTASAKLPLALQSYCGVSIPNGGPPPHLIDKLRALHSLHMATRP